MTINDLILEQYLLEELPPEKMEIIATQLKTDADLQRRLDELITSNQSLLKDYPSHIMTANIKARLRQEKLKSGKSFFWSKPFYVMAAAAMALLVTIPMMQSDNPPLIPATTETGIRTKGDKAGIYIYRKIQGDIEKLSNGSRAKQGDLLQIAYFSINDSYGILLSIDGRGTVTLHFPENSSQSPKLEQYQKTLLPSSYELDDAPLFERFFFITSSKPFQTDGILKRVQTFAANKEKVRQDDLPLDSVYTQLSVLILKGE